MKVLNSSLIFIFFYWAANIACARDSFGETEQLAKQYKQHSVSQSTDARSLLQTINARDIKYIIDVGCRCGNSTKVVADLFPNAKLLGIDPEISLLDVARKQFTNNKHVSFMQGDVLTFKAPEPADLIFGAFLMHWVPRSEQPEALANIRANLKKNGKLALIMSSSKEGLPFQKALNRLIRQSPYAGALTNFHNTQVFYKVDEYRGFLEQSGFFVENIGYSYNEKQYKDRNDLRLWLQQWLPYAKQLAKTSTQLRDEFMKELVQQFIIESGQQQQAPLVWGEYVLSVIAHKQ